MKANKDTSPRPWSVEITGTALDPARSIKIIDARGGVVALMKAAGGRKLANADAIIQAVNHANPS